MKRLYLILTFLIIAFFIRTNAFALQRPDEISISDFSGIISDGTKNYVKLKNETLFSATQAKIIFVTTNSTDGLSATEYTENLYSSWGIGQIGRGNSILIVMCPETEDYGVYQGSGIKRVLYDSILYKYIIEDFEPHFAKGNYDDAVLYLYNRLGKWYEENYSGLKLGLDENVEMYKTSNITADREENINKVIIWISIGLFIILAIILLKIKRNIDYKARRKERRKKRKIDKANIDKIVNSW